MNFIPHPSALIPLELPPEGGTQNLLFRSNFMSNNNLETATLGAGCFWCVEAVFDDLKGVEDVVSGYSGGHTENPTYREVCSETTGHAEVTQIKFDPEVISFADILRVFFAVHDPTTLNRQGNDIGTSYRSAIFYHSDEQKKTAEEIIKEVTEAEIYDRPIVTEVTKFDKFYPAEDYHQEYFANNPTQPYCAAVVAPKVAKFRKQFVSRLKK
jgi:peptide-methionine (S)-S-oxide reductase